VQYCGGWAPRVRFCDNALRRFLLKLHTNLVHARRDPLGAWSLHPSQSSAGGTADGYSRYFPTRFPPLLLYSPARVAASGLYVMVSTIPSCRSSARTRMTSVSSWLLWV